MRHVLLVAAVVLCSCIAGVGDETETEEDHLADATASVNYDACDRACALIATGECDWVSQCADGDWPYIAFCGVYVTCEGAEAAAASAGGPGYAGCLRDCSNLRP